MFVVIVMYEMLFFIIICDLHSWKNSWDHVFLFKVSNVGFILQAHTSSPVSVKLHCLQL